MRGEVDKSIIRRIFLKVLCFDTISVCTLQLPATKHLQIYSLFETLFNMQRNAQMLHRSKTTA